MNVTIDISEVALKTKRLVLRLFREEDLNDFFEYASVDGVGQMAGWSPHKNKEETKIILDSFIMYKKTFAVVFDNKVIGSIGIEEYNEDEYPELKDLKCRELGFVLSKDYWGQGIIPEACKEVIRYLFEDVSLDVVCCGYFEDNLQSARVQQKLGFHYHSKGDYTDLMGVVHKCVRNTLTKEEWVY